MKETDPAVGARWQAALAAPDVLEVRQALRLARDGSGQLWAVVVLADEPPPASARLKALEVRLREIMLADPGQDGGGCLVFVSFNTREDVPALASKCGPV